MAFIHLCHLLAVSFATRVACIIAGAALNAVFTKTYFAYIYFEIRWHLKLKLKFLMIKMIWGLIMGQGSTVHIWNS